MSPPPDELEELPRRVTTRIKTEVERPDFGLRLIIIMKFVKAALLIIFATAVLRSLHRDLHDVIVSIVSWFKIDPANERVELILAKITGLTPKNLAEISAGAYAYSIVLFIEGWGLHNRRVWAEWFTIIITSSLVPVEIFELVRHRSVGKGVALLINVVVVLYLARHHFLFVPGPIGRWLHRTFGSERAHHPAAKPPETPAQGPPTQAPPST